MTTGVKSDYQLEWDRREAAMPKAIRLRELGLTYTAIAAVMGEYHGVYYAPMTWRHHMVGRMGVPLKVPGRLTPPQRREVAA